MVLSIPLAHKQAARGERKARGPRQREKRQVSFPAEGKCARFGERGSEEERGVPHVRTRTVWSTQSRHDYNCKMKNKHRLKQSLLCGRRGGKQERREDGERGEPPQTSGVSARTNGAK
ncbi:unnamed protein product [Prorocentrum cordatum]|uniref:Uncharacterized protein n=1 Tax=Prorocentrum cordatum TaxID=2364126 RepID=A0ABN9TNQ3_9DINO|nr:unnamed protein product [Polarella glacialis]